MAGSTVKLQWCFNYVAAQGTPDPTRGAGGFGSFLAYQLASNVMNDLISERFNWKWNRAFAAPFLTNSYQQDYPQVGITDMGWLEYASVVDINNTQYPKPLGTARVVRDLPPLSQFLGSGPGGVDKQTLSWDYNKNLQYGTWPGPGVTYTPLITAQVKQNPLMSMIDANGNLMIVTTPGTTLENVDLQITTIETLPFSPVNSYNVVITYAGPSLGISGGSEVALAGLTHVTALNGKTLTTLPISNPPGNTLFFSYPFILGAYNGVETGTADLTAGAPQAPAESEEGTTVADGTVVWTVVGPNSVGFRIGPLPGPTGPVYQIGPCYQMKPVRFTETSGVGTATGMNQTIDPIPDDFSTTFLRGLEFQCKGASADPNDRKEFAAGYGPWLEELAKARKQGDREADAYGMLPASSVVENVYGWLRNPQDPSQPY